MNVLVDETSLQGIANAIREKNGTEDTYKPSEMPQAIRDIQSGDIHYDTFWDAFQQNGARTNYEKVFSNGYFNLKTFKPKHDMKPTSAQQMFSLFPDECDLREILNDCGITIDFSKATGNYVFQASRFTALPTINCPNGIYMWFQNCSLLHTIDKLVVNKNMTAVQLNGFSGCNVLKKVIIDGEIGANIDIKSAPLLTVASVKSILTHLVNYAGTEKEFACSVIFHSDVWTRLDSLGNDSPNGNTWREYVNDLGWNAS